MPFYHVRITQKGKAKDAIELNLSERKLVNLILEKNRLRQKFACGGELVNPADVSKMKITKSEQPLALDHPDYFKLEYGDLWRRVEDQEDVTKKFVEFIPESIPISKNVFIVHGRDDKQALLLQKYLKDKLKVDAVMFDDLPDKGRTIIEQLEYIQHNVGYVFVIVTPDDVGCLTEDIKEAGMLVAGLKSVTGETVGKIFDLFHTRARQNVVFELGLFMGALGREKVCCLLKQDTEEKPSDIDGILYKLFNKSVSEIFHEIPEELREAGYEIKM